MLTLDSKDGIDETLIPYYSPLYQMDLFIYASTCNIEVKVLASKPQIVQRFVPVQLQKKIITRADFSSFSEKNGNLSAMTISSSYHLPVCFRLVYLPRFGRIPFSFHGATVINLESRTGPNGDGRVTWTAFRKTEEKRPLPSFGTYK